MVAQKEVATTHFALEYYFPRNIFLYVEYYLEFVIPTWTISQIPRPMLLIPIVLAVAFLEKFYWYQMSGNQVYTVTLGPWGNSDNSDHNHIFSRDSSVE